MAALSFHSVETKDNTDLKLMEPHGSKLAILGKVKRQQLQIPDRAKRQLYMSGRVKGWW